jgi:aconitase A
LVNLVVDLISVLVYYNKTLLGKDSHTTKET